jgi:hypothetical protein
MSADEHSKNRTFEGPIAKLQHDLLIAVLEIISQNTRTAFYGLTAAKRLDYMKNAVNRDQNL